ncbi:MAG: hypothetical protein M3O50_11600 [Myxococcota bacterium]|nr:hypothetical protein [Myxococcota bacterium]
MRGGQDGAVTTLDARSQIFHVKAEDKQPEQDARAVPSVELLQDPNLPRKYSDEDAYPRAFFEGSARRETLPHEMVTRPHESRLFVASSGIPKRPELAVSEGGALVRVTDDAKRELLRARFQRRHQHEWAVRYAEVRTQTFQPTRRHEKRYLDVGVDRANCEAGAIARFLRVRPVDPPPCASLVWRARLAKQDSESKSCLDQRFGRWR